LAVVNPQPYQDFIPVTMRCTTIPLPLMNHKKEIWLIAKNRHRQVSVFLLCTRWQKLNGAIAAGSLGTKPMP
jgi:hypothetical protein